MTRTSLGIVRAKEQQTTAEQRLKDMIKYFVGTSGQGSGTQVARAHLTQEQEATAASIADYANRLRQRPGRSRGPMASFSAR